MANENRLIYASDAQNAILKAPTFEVEYYGMKNHVLIPTVAEALIKGIPSVDAVEVVRCKHCESYDPGYIRPYCGWCSTWETAVKESGYCHHGERRTDE